MAITASRLSVSSTLQLIVIIIVFSSKGNCAQQSDGIAPMILEAPSSLLVPVNTQAPFVCRAHCPMECSIQWFFGREHQRAVNNDSPGIVLNDSHQENGTYSSGILINATADFNRTYLTCYVVLDGRGGNSARSNPAMLLIILQSPVMPNPVVVVQNQTSLLLMWSPPFLWSGYHIDYFNISTTNEISSIIHYDIINTSFDDAIVTLSKTPDISDQQGHKCNQLMFEVRSYNNHLGLLSPAFNIPGSFPSAIGDISESEFNVSVLFTAKATPLVQIRIMLSSSIICGYQEFNYTITITDMDGNNTLKLEPKNRRGSGYIEHDILGLKKDHVYSMRTIFFVKFYREILYTHTFSDLESTHPRNDNVHYKVALGVCGCITLMMFVVLIITLLCVCYTRELRAKSLNNSISTVARTMVHNPIYDGPVYDSIQEDNIRALTPIASSLAKADVSDQLPYHGNNTTVRSYDVKDEKSIDKTRYITTPNRSLQTPSLCDITIDSRDDPGSYSLHTNPVAEVIATNNDYEQEKQLTHFIKEKNSDHNLLNMDFIGEKCSTFSLTTLPMACANPLVLSNLPIDGTYIVMNPSGSPTVSRWGKLSSEDTEEIQ